MPYRRITYARYDPARHDDVRSLGPAIYAAFCRLPGFQGMYEGSDCVQGTTTLVSIWDTEEHASFSRGALGTVISRLHTLGVQFAPPEIVKTDA